MAVVQAQQTLDHPVQKPHARYQEQEAQQPETHHGEQARRDSNRHHPEQRPPERADHPVHVAFVDRAARVVALDVIDDERNH